jgi:hypothetical protein
MNRGILFVGNSHAACRYHALAELRTGGLSRGITSWICQGANITPFSVDRDKRVVLPAFSSRKSTLFEVYVKHGGRIAEQDIAADPGLPLDEITDVVVSSVGARPPGVLLHQHICHFMGSTPASEALIAAWIGSQPQFTVLMERLRDLRQVGFQGRIFVTPRVRPVALPDSCTLENWTRFCDIDMRAMRAALAHVDATLLPFPSGTEILTPRELATGKAAGVHGTKEYGELINRILLQHLDAQEAGSPALRAAA